ncbi:MAG: pseudoazurin [Steroidobacteraceae bacterium]
MAATAVLVAGAASAAEFEVKMLNKGAKGEMVFEPDVVRMAPGDTVHFVVVDRGHAHDAVSIRGMLPEGAEPFEGEPDRDVTVTFTVPGVYGYKCSPHYSTYGMVGLVIVGDPVNIEAVKKVRQFGASKKRFAEIFASL